MWSGLNLPAGSLVEGAATSGVTPQALGAGYVVFFLYSTVIGVFAWTTEFWSPQRRAGIEDYQFIEWLRWHRGPPS